MGDKRLYKSSENSMLCGVCGPYAGASGMGDPYLLWRCGNLGIYHCGNYYSEKITESQDPICNRQKFNRIRQAAKRIANIRLNEIQYKN